MDTEEEATSTLFSRIKTIEPDHATKIMGYILLQDQPEKEILRLAFGPESLLSSLVSVAKSRLGISSNTLSAPGTVPPPAPVSTNNGFSVAVSRPHPVQVTVSSPRVGSNGGVSSPDWGVSGPKNIQLQQQLVQNHGLSYAAVVNGSNGTFSPSISPNPVVVSSKSVDFGVQLTDLGSHMSPRSGRSDSAVFPYTNCDKNVPHFGSGFDGFKSCVYFDRGFCKNGSDCDFVHGEECGDDVVSPCKFDAFEQDLMRAKVVAAQQQQRLAAAAQFMASSGGGGGVNFPHHKLNFLQSEAHRSVAASMMMGDEFHKLNKCRMGGGVGFGAGDVSPGSRQIYLTFPADSTFREEDVSNYFRIYGPVQDVRIPYQQKRMFGFVTFVYPETVKLILAKGNPHFVCDSRVLVKPYKEKGKLPDKKQQQFERNEFSSCSIPSSGIDCREPFDIPLGSSRMMYNAQEMLWRRKLEQQAGLQHALELQGRRLMNLKLMDLKSHYHPLHDISVVGSPICSPHLNVVRPSNGSAHDTSEGEDIGNSTTTPDSGQLMAEEVNAAGASIDGITGKESNSINDECDLPESFEHILPDNLFSSPKKSAAGDHRSIFSSSASSDVEHRSSSPVITSNDSLMMTSTLPLSRAPLKSCFLEMPRFTSGHEAIGNVDF